MAEVQHMAKGAKSEVAVDHHEELRLRLMDLISRVGFLPTLKLIIRHQEITESKLCQIMGVGQAHMGWRLAILKNTYEVVEYERRGLHNYYRVRQGLEVILPSLLHKVEQNYEKPQNVEMRLAAAACQGGVRRAILTVLLRGSVSLPVMKIVESTGCTQSAVSHELENLQEMGLLESSVDGGKRAFFHLSSAGISEQLKGTLQALLKGQIPTGRRIPWRSLIEKKLRSSQRPGSPSHHTNVRAKNQPPVASGTPPPLSGDPTQHWIRACLQWFAPGEEFLKTYVNPLLATARDAVKNKKNPLQEVEAHIQKIRLRHERMAVAS